MKFCSKIEKRGIKDKTVEI